MISTEDDLDQNKLKVYKQTVRKPCVTVVCFVSVLMTVKQSEADFDLN